MDPVVPIRWHPNRHPPRQDANCPRLLGGKGAVSREKVGSRGKKIGLRGKRCPPPDAVQVMDPVLPSEKVLSKYGLDAGAWMDLFRAQDGVCAVCRKLPTTARLCVDHDHAPGWKKMPPEERVRYVRGLLCFWCNKTYVGRAITVEKAQRVVEYLEAYAARRPTSDRPKRARRPRSSPAAGS